MQKKFLILCSLIMVAITNSDAQEFSYKSLSNVYQFKLLIKKEWDGFDSAIKTITVKIQKKSNSETIQTLILSNDERFDADLFQSNTSGRSFITGVNKTPNSQLLGDDGDFVVGDFNYDGREDFAIRKFTGNGLSGSHFIFFTSRTNGLFKEDKFLTSEIHSMPNLKDLKNKTVSQWVYVGPHTNKEIIYRYSVESAKWIVINSVLHKT